MGNRTRLPNVAFIPIRAGSKAIPNKNIKDMAGKPLYEWVTDAALAADCIDEVWISTESADYHERIVKRYQDRVRIHMRPDILATDTAATDDVMLHFALEYDFDKIVLAQATNPLLKAADLDEACTRMDAVGYDSLLSCIPRRRFFWTKGGHPISHDPSCRPFREGVTPVYEENGAFFITKRKRFLESRCRISGYIGIYEMSPLSDVDIDEPEDWATVEQRLVHES